MSASLSRNINLLPAIVPEESFRLHEDGFFIGLLRDIIEPEQEPIVLACIEWEIFGIHLESLVEVQRELGPKLWELQGKKIILTMMRNGKHRVERYSQ